ATIAVRRAELLTGYQIDREMVLEDVNTGLLGDRGQQGPLDFASGHILRVQNPAFGVAALLPEVQLARAIRARDFAFGKVHTQLDQFGDSRRSFLDDGANNGFFAQTRPSLERVAHVQRIRDRKSTRLNSSHVAISYAVFCLKKKKNRYKIFQIDKEKYYSKSP